MHQRTIGDRGVWGIGLGGMPMSIEGRPDAARSSATIHAALDAGLTLIDTADAYHRDAGEVGHNEELIARALREYGEGDEVLVATKGGHCAPVTAPGPATAIRSTSNARSRSRRGALVSRRSACISFTVPTRLFRTPSRSVRSATCSTRG